MVAPGSTRSTAARAAASRARWYASLTLAACQARRSD
jgi:hypothetical protein